MPQSWANAVLVRQIVSAATSIGANIAEGHGRYTPGAHRNHLSIARGSAAETDSWLDLFRRSGWITGEEEALLHKDCDAIIAMLTAKMRDLDLLAKESARVQEEQAHYHPVYEPQRPAFPFTTSDYQNESTNSQS